MIGNKINKNDYEGIAKYASIIQQSSQRALNLLENLLEWSRAQTGRLVFNPEFFEMASLISDTISVVKYSAEQKSITIKADIPESITVFADKQMISTIIRNLVSNAIKYSHKGDEIIISAKHNSNEVLMTVSDNGVGIAPDKVHKLFKIGQVESTPQPLFADCRLSLSLIKII